MITLNDYLYSGDTIFRILRKYSSDLRENARESGNRIDLAHSDFLLGIEDQLEHNDFLTSQSQRIREFYKYMAARYPYLAFTFKGRIKSLIRAEEKFNGYIVEYTTEYYQRCGSFPEVGELVERVSRFRDLIAYRIVISMPKCHLKDGEDREEVELKYLYEIASALPGFLAQRGFTPEPSGITGNQSSPLLDEAVRPYYRDYVANQKSRGYRSLHIAFYDNQARCYIEVQLRTKQMDDYAEIGVANHAGYEAAQNQERARGSQVPAGECVYFDEAYGRGMALQNLDLSKVDVNMFTAISSQLINDGCGLYRGRLILPYEHLSRFQNDIVD